MYFNVHFNVLYNVLLPQTLVEDLSSRHGRHLVYVSSSFVKTLQNLSHRYCLRLSRCGAKIIVLFVYLD